MFGYEKGASSYCPVFKDLQWCTAKLVFFFFLFFFFFLMTEHGKHLLIRLFFCQVLVQVDTLAYLPQLKLEQPYCKHFS